MNALEQATTEELFNEIKGRHEVSLLLTRGSPGDEDGLLLLKGGWDSEMLGMLEWAKAMLIRRMVEESGDA